MRPTGWSGWKWKKTPSLVEKLFLRRTVTSGCGKGTTFYNALDTLITEKIDSPLKIRVDQVFHLMRRLAEGFGVI